MKLRDIPSGNAQEGKDSRSSRLNFFFLRVYLSAWEEDLRQTNNLSRTLQYT